MIKQKKSQQFEIQDTRSLEPIAVVGIGCRFPGGITNAQTLWSTICNRTDAIVDIPKDRLDLRRFYDQDANKPGKMYIRQAGFLQENHELFDPMFFGISPREAQSLDPQQRLILEVAWEAFEDAGFVLDELKGSDTGVFIGGFCLDSMMTQFDSKNRHLINSNTSTGTALAILSNRISYFFDFRGPSVSMDTACSSSLVSTHYACQSIWNGECSLAVAGGVNIMTRPEFPIVMSKGRFLSRTGRCMSFDERADGYARGEGAGVVVLKPLDAAIADNDQIYSIIRATGVNQDGHTASMTVPNMKSQERLIQRVCSIAQVQPGRVQYVEAHGTGTQAGDIAEAFALDAVLSRGREKMNEMSCWLRKNQFGPS